MGGALASFILCPLYLLIAFSASGRSILSYHSAIMHVSVLGPIRS